MELSYTINEGCVCVDKVVNPDAAVEIPEEIDGLPVTELGAYALSGSDIQEIRLPSRMEKIGAYAFYSCQKLHSLYCYGRAVDLGTGIFADDRELSFLDITLYEGERSCLKELLSEMRQTLRVRIHEVEEVCGQRRVLQDRGEQARLIFPEFFEEAVENTPARKFFTETHGCGQRYRYCFVRREFQYAAYDALFPHVEVQEPEELAAELAMGRLRYPRGLGSGSRERYAGYLKKHWKTAARLLVQADRPSRWEITNLEAGCLPWLVEKLLQPDRKQVQEIIEIAQDGRDTEMVSYLMDYLHRAFPENTYLEIRDEGGNMPAKEAFLLPFGGAEKKPQRRRRRFEI